MHRPAQRLTRVLACAAAVTVIIGASGCSSDSGSDDAGKKTPANASASGAATSPSGGSSAPKVPEAAYAKLPDPCESLAKKTREDLVPKGGAGKASTSDDTATRGTCSWSSLDNNGVKGSQFRWLNVSLLRFDSDQTRGAGDKLAGEYLAKQVQDAEATNGAKKLGTTPLSGTGDEARTVRYDLKKKEGDFKQQTVVARVENVVVTLDYNGAGLAGDKTPDAAALTKAAERAAKEVVAAVVAANEKDAAPSASGDKGKTKDRPKDKPKDKSGDEKADADGGAGASPEAPAKNKSPKATS